jgi:hypothetical protein
LWLIVSLFWIIQVVKIFVVGGDDNIRMNLEIGCVDVDCIYLAQDRAVWVSCTVRDLTG